ncbi:MAG: TlpA family protein disulfide reductase [Verrucomicrobiaceae bacterium]|nr:TlpA family protein disulfide reductase [Verrucomicrobiaceae bacterium]
MKIPSRALSAYLLLSLTSYLPAQQPASAPPAPAAPAQTPTAPSAPESPEQIRAEATKTAQEILQQMFNPSIPLEELEKLAKDANKMGVPRQQIIEARLIYGLRNLNVPYLLKLLPEAEVLAKNFDPAQSAAIPSAEAVQSFIAYIHALKAKGDGNKDEFKKHILEAIWLQPSQAPVFIQTIESHRREIKMATLKVDMALPIVTSMGETTTLGDLVHGKKAVLIDFWASWCGPCMQLMPTLKKEAEELAKYGIAVIAMNKDDEVAETIAERIRKEQDMHIPWLIEPKERPFTQLFEIQTLPRTVLLSPEGKVLFNGMLQDPGLWAALKKINSAIEPPH